QRRLEAAKLQRAQLVDAGFFDRLQLIPRTQSPPSPLLPALYGPVAAFGSTADRRNFDAGSFPNRSRVGDCTAHASIAIFRATTDPKTPRGTTMKKRTTPVSRRTVVKTGAAAIAAPAVLGLIPANAQGKTIKIGHVSPRTGPLAGFGEADN